MTVSDRDAPWLPEMRDIGKFKVPGIRVWPHARPTSITARLRPLLDVVNFYDQRFNMGLTDEEKLTWWLS